MAQHKREYRSESVPLFLAQGSLDKMDPSQQSDNEREHGSMPDLLDSSNDDGEKNQGHPIRHFLGLGWIPIDLVKALRAGHTAALQVYQSIGFTALTVNSPSPSRQGGKAASHESS